MVGYLLKEDRGPGELAPSLDTAFLNFSGPEITNDTMLLSGLIQGQH